MGVPTMKEYHRTAGNRFCFAIPAYPQAFTANLTGLVLDPNQAAAPNAEVKLTNQSNREDGNFRGGTLRFSRNSYPAAN